MRSFTAETEVAMRTLQTSYHLRFVRGGLGLCWIVLAMGLAAHAQTQAACTFNFFSPTTQFKLQDGTPVFIQSVGINDFGTIVGYSIPGTVRGLIRWANGGVTKVKGTSALLARNDNGTSVGFDLTSKAVLVGPTIAPIVIDVNNSVIDEVNGMNKWDTIVGRYVDSSGGHGFKRWKNGSTHTLDFPGAQQGFTEPHGVNDNDTVVGSYADNSFFSHGFIFHNGQWATLDYPHASDTELVGITNAGKIIGNAFVNSSRTLFLYENGTFKVISVPNSASGTSLESISPKQGLILGITDVGAGEPAFIAQCQ